MERSKVLTRPYEAYHRTRVGRIEPASWEHAALLPRVMGDGEAIGQRRT